MRRGSGKLWTAVAALTLSCGEAPGAASAPGGGEPRGEAQSEAEQAALAARARGERAPEREEHSSVWQWLGVENGFERGQGQAPTRWRVTRDGEPSEPSAPEPEAPPSAATKVEIELTQAVDDFVYASVDGLRKQVWYIDEPGQQRRFDVSSWFAAGEHALRLQAINTVGPASYGVRVWVDGALVLDAQCSAQCSPEAPRGIIFDRTLKLTTLGPPPQLVHVTSAAPGKLYVDDAFTGLTTTGTAVPVSVSLPPGEHTIGLGVSDDSPPAYSGSYFERSITLGGSAVSVDFSAAEPPLPVQERTRIALLPVRSFVVDTFDAVQVGVLAEGELSELEPLARATREQWLEPFSYGLASWDLELLPVVEDVALHARAHDDVPDAEGLLAAAGLEHLRSEYELVVLYYDLFDDEGNVLAGVVNGEAVEVAGAAYGGGGLVWFNTAFVGSYGERTGPNPALLHEVLHNYESYNERGRHYYLGADGLHGGEEHGYYAGDGGEVDFALFQRLYMRNQIAEVSSTRVDVAVASPAPQADLWVGVFDTLRRGYSPL